MSLLPVEEAQARLLARALPLPVNSVDLLGARGGWLAEPVAALRDQPWAALSAMDGYAIRHAELPGPWTLTGESRAGGVAPTDPLPHGTTIRIFTGAPLPEGADCILVQEDAQAEGATIHLSGEGPSGPGRHVRPRAADFANGSRLLDAGTFIRPAEIALAAIGGHARLPVHRAPRVALIGTGDELVPVGQPAGPGQLPASNSVMLAAMLAAEGAEVLDLGLIPDNLDTLADAFRAAATADIIVSTGGASVGDHDLVAPAILQAGGALDFWRIAMRPGKPLMAGRLDDALLLGLPGNPVSAFVTATLFLLPLVRAMRGAPDPLPRRVTARTAVALPAGGPRAEYLRATVMDGVVTHIADRDSAALLPLAHSNALVERAAHAAPAAAGEDVRIIPIGNG
ncbi:MAG: gephyrin-like molybdotransferase Glp, partial [Sphingobium sp.]